MQRDEIQYWLDTTQIVNNDNNKGAEIINDDDNNQEADATKRRRLNDYISQPVGLSPPPSNRYRNYTHAMDSPSLKRCRDDDTPQVKPINRPSRSYSSEHSSSAQSSQFSPLRQMSRLKDTESDLEVRSFVMSRMPPEARRLIADIATFADGKGIVSVSIKDALIKAAQSDIEFEWALLGSDIFIDDSDSVVCTPPPETVLDNFIIAEDCYVKRCPAATWNQEVYHELLTLSLRPRGQPRLGHLVNFAPRHVYENSQSTPIPTTHSILTPTHSTTAAVLPDYGRPTALRKVDYCMYIEPENDAALSDTYRAAAERMRKVMPEERLNFTDHHHLKGRFVGLSIATTRPGEDVEAGQLQLGLWEMARSDFLLHLAAGVYGDEDISAAAEAGPAPTARLLPSFLPGLVVQGHDWFLVVTTAEGQKTVLWSKLAVGSTSSTRGIYQIIRTLQYLARWVGDVHWPCIRRLLRASD